MRIVGPMRTSVPLRAILAPAVRTRARATLPKLPSPISLSNSNLSSNPKADVEPLDDPRGGKSCGNVIVQVLVYLILRAAEFQVCQGKGNVRPLAIDEEQALS